MSLKLSNHANKRAAQRCLWLEDLNYVEEYGQEIHKAGVVFYFLRACDLPHTDRTMPGLNRLAGTAVVVGKDGETVITTWRNRRNGLRRIKRKMNYGQNAPSGAGKSAWFDE